MERMLDERWLYIYLDQTTHAQQCLAEGKTLATT